MATPHPFLAWSPLTHRALLQEHSWIQKHPNLCFSSQGRWDPSASHHCHPPEPKNDSRAGTEVGGLGREGQTALETHIGQADAERSSSPRCHVLSGWRCQGFCLFKVMEEKGSSKPLGVREGMTLWRTWGGLWWCRRGKCRGVVHRARKTRGRAGMMQGTGTRTRSSNAAEKGGVSEGL